MPIVKAYNLAKVTTATTGTGTITLGSAVSGFLTFAQAGVQDGDYVSYGISDGANSEVGRGTYTSSGTTLTRSVLRSTNSNSPISLSGTAKVFIAPLAEDVRPSVPTIVQHKSAQNASSMSTTLTSAPTTGNILIAICNNFSGLQTAASGWAKVNSNGNGLDYTDILVRAVSGDTATINPTTGSGLVYPTVSIWEISGASIGFLNAAGTMSYCDPGFSSSTLVTLKQWLLSTSNIMLFNFVSGTTTPPTGANATQDASISGANRSVFAGHVDGANSATSVTATYGSSSSGKMSSIVLMPG